MGFFKLLRRIPYLTHASRRRGGVAARRRGTNQCRPTSTNINMQLNLHQLISPSPNLHPQPAWCCSIRGHSSRQRAAAVPPRQPFKSSNNNPHINLSPDLIMISSSIAHSELTNLIKYQTFLPPITQPAHPGKYQTNKIAWHPNAPNGNECGTRRKHGLIS